MLLSAPMSLEETDPDEAFCGVSLAEIDAAAGQMQSLPGGTFYESTADFLKSLEGRT